MVLLENAIFGNIDQSSFVYGPSDCSRYCINACTIQRLGNRMPL